MTKREKKVIETLNAIIKNKKCQMERESDREEKRVLSQEIWAYQDAIYLLTYDEFLNYFSKIYKDC